MNSQNTFDLVEQRFIETLNLSVVSYVHQETGAEHIHFETDNVENVFLVALRTMPQNSTGVAHILEHTALCGSKRYPIRDPFFLMIRRSLNTFMNAFTGSDCTYYPFASQNRKDFFNLLDVYLDSVFFSRLDPLDFAQEGHRFELNQPGKSQSELILKGIVYNEMKGEMSAPLSQLYAKLNHYLYPTTTYHYNSGGDPKEIPLLKYQDLKAFYQSHYHPSNAIFMTYGDIPVSDLQSRLENNVLQFFKRRSDLISVSPEVRYSQPIRAIEYYPELCCEKRTHVVLAWLFGESRDLMMLMRCNLLSEVLLGTSASPLRKALEGSHLGSAVSPLSGLEDSNFEMSFVCGFEGCANNQEDAIEELVINTLRKIRDEGIPKAQLESVLHQYELAQREIAGEGVPYGLQVMSWCLSAAVHRGAPLSAIDLDPAIARLREEIKDQDFICELVQTLLLDNKHRVTLIMKPDPEMSVKESAEEESRLAMIKRKLDERGLQAIEEQAFALQERQSAPEDLSILPKVGLEDIGPPRKDPIRRFEDAPTPITSFRIGTNGITYHQIVTALPKLTSEETSLLPLYNGLISEIGSDSRGYEQTQLIQQALSGGIHGFLSARACGEDFNKYSAYCFLSSKTMPEKVEAMFTLMKETALKPNFEEGERIRDLVKQFRVRRDAGITGNGHMLAAGAAAASLHPITSMSYKLSGLGSIFNLRELDDSLKDKSNLELLQGSLESLHTRLLEGSRQLLLVSDPSTESISREALKLLWQERQGFADNFVAEVDGFESDVAFVTNTKINFCASVYPTIEPTNEDSPVLTVLAAVLKNGYLHSEIREKGGAYGGGAIHDWANGVFKFYSFRDPNLLDTFAAFEKSMEWVTGAELSSEIVEEAVLGVISGLDAPGTPAGEAKQSFHHKLFGNTLESRQEFRERVIATRVQDIRRVATSYFQSGARRAVITNAQFRHQVESKFDVVEL